MSDLENERLARAQKQKPIPQAGHRNGNKPADISVGQTLGSHSQASQTLNPSSSPRQLQNIGAQGSPRRNSSPFSRSPHRGAMSSSPRHLSPATSQIFERDVQESTSHAPELSPAIPSHIQTEDHIPPVLDASSHAITEDMQPDEVEIVTHTAHQPAAVTLASGSSYLSESHTPAYGSTTDLGMHQDHQDHEEGGSPLGAVDPQDPRRLSFISFADVVNSEHIEGGKDSAHFGNLSSGSPSAGNRSPSPVRSPASNDRIPITPPTSGSVSFHGLETSPVRGGNASTVSGSGPSHGELTIETMRQAVKKTGSNELTGTASQPMSATSADDSKEHFLK